MSQLPSSWRETPIETVTEVVSGGTPSSKHPEYYTEDHKGSIAWVTPADLSGYKEKYISHGRRSITKSGYDSCSAKLMPKGTVLFSSRAPIGYTVIAANEISTNQGFKSFVPIVGVNETYLYYYLRSIKHLAESLATGTTFKELSGKVAKTLPFPLAPFAEQTRIVEKLDEVLAQVDTIKARLDGIPAILKRFRQSVLAAAVSGKLTEEWRGSRDYIQYGLQLAKRDQSLDIPENWKPQKLEDSCGIVSGNAFKSKDLLDSGDIPVVKISNVQYGKFEVKNQQFLPSSFLDGHKKYLIVEDDLLMALTRPITNGTLKVCRYPVNQTDGLLNQRVCKFEFKNNEEKNFFELLFQSSYFKEQVEDNLSETLQPNLSPKDLKRLLVFIPELDEQKEIVRLVDQYFAFADTIYAQVKKAQARVDKLTPSILAKAFRGELVPQDPNDEPADKLLERIAAARKEAEALAKAAKKATNL
ncbi:specificity determinant for hsdM and hsdR [Vibrio cholerae]|uniref:restriction endonuclease subunit S n=1 Tax=Vibrio cholerae TaxID=666 RepID=UPI00115926CF|nr:restriction endonuclease subunit S [Vibrio cholerae]TQP23949.1 specificity determinant for hsdM and hsdR [Vibrio cholerae]